MSRNYNFHNPSGLYFVSFAVVKWLKVFTQDAYKDILVDSLIHCQTHKGMELFAWCIMTNHAHLVYRCNEENNPGKVLGDFKRFTSKQVVKAIGTNPQESRKEYLLNEFARAASESSNVQQYQFWRHDNQPIELWSNPVIKQKIDYVHNNPVKAGLVLKPQDYLYSSALDYADGQGLIPNVIIAKV